MEVLKRIKPINPGTGRTHEVSVIYAHGKACRKSFSIRDTRDTAKILEALFELIRNHSGDGIATHYLCVKNTKTRECRSKSIRSDKKLTTEDLSNLLLEKLRRQISCH